MSDGITFNNREEAAEYIKQQQREGNYTVLHYNNGKYIVTVKSGSPELKGRNIAQVFTDEKTGEKFIVASEKLSTHSKLHELGHIKTEQHETGAVDEMLDNELRAEKYAVDKMGKEISERTLLGLATRVKEKNRKYDPAMINYVINEAMKRNNIEVSDKTKEELKQDIFNTF